MTLPSLTLSGGCIKRLQILLLVTLLAGVFLLVLNLLEFLALTDIYHDYVSPQVILQIGGNPGALPEWSAASDEWAIVRLSRFTSAAYLLVALPALFLCWRALQKPAGPPTAPQK